MAGGSSHIFAFPPSPGIALSLSNCSDYGMVWGALRGLGNPSMTVQGCFVFVLVFFSPDVQPSIIAFGVGKVT